MRDRILKAALGIGPLRRPSAADEVLAAELRATFRRLPTLDTTDALPTQAAWSDHMNRLKMLALHQDPRNFLRWDVVTRTMFVVFASYVSKELKHLQRLPDWKSRWRKAIRESPAGHPIPYILYPASSCNLIHHAYHVAQFEDKADTRVQDLDHVLEFGGGYGGMCRLFYNLGFHGRYIILDLPGFSALQLYFLKSLGLPVRSTDERPETESGIVCLSDLRQLGDLLPRKMGPGKSLFLATWSVSEAPISVRNEVLPLLSEFRSFLIAYQDRFGEVDNVEFFDRWKASLKDVSWRTWGIEHSPGNYYLVGTTLSGR
jgi:hypothetical protein